MEIQKKYSLKEINTFGIDVKAKWFAKFDSLNILLELLKEVGVEDELLILGGGSNILFTKDYKGFVFKNELKGIDIVEDNSENVLLKVGGGEIWHEFVLFCIKNGFGGVENMSLIPGTVGAAPIQNIGAYGVEQKDVFVKLEALNLSTKEIEIFDFDKCNFGYRDSFFKKWGKGQYVITNVYYKLHKEGYSVNTNYGAIDDQLKLNNVKDASIADVSKAVIQIRQSKLPDPAKIGNSGSFFKNPVISIEQFNQVKEKHPEIKFYPIDESKVKVPAGWLIEQAGWKGLTFDNKYGVHKKQSLVLVNYGEAKGKDVKELALNIIRDIDLKFGIKLEAEVNIL